MRSAPRAAQPLLPGLAPLGALVAALLLAGCGASETAAPAAPPQPVRVAEARPAPEANLVRAAGTLLFKRETPLSFKIGGVIESFAVDDGDAVTAGQLLATLKPAEIAAQEQEAEAAYDLAAAELRRAVELERQGFASAARVDNARASARRAEAALKTVRFNRSFAELRAPGGGLVLQRRAEAGQIVQAGATVMLVGDAAAGFILRLPLPDSAIARIAMGDAATVRLPALGADVPGKVTRMAGKAAQGTGAFDVEITLAGLPEGARSGMIGEAVVTPSRPLLTAAVAIPAAAILEGNGAQASVFVVDGASAVRRVAVRVGALAGGDAYITEGLATGARVITAGAPYLRDGQTVAIVADTAGTQPQAN